MKKGKSTKNTSTIWYITASLFYVCSCIWFFSSDSRSLAVMYLCLGSAALCTGASIQNKKNKENESDK